MKSNFNYSFKETKTGRKQKPQKIVHQIFYEMSDIEEDPFWKTEFVKASHGRFPSKVSYKNGIIYFVKSNKREKMYLPEDIMDAIENYKGFIHKNTWNRSRAEYEEDNKMNEDRISKNKSIQDFQWKELKKKKTKELLIMNYINDLAKEYEMSIEDKYELNISINTGIINGMINTSSIEYEDGMIHHIKGLEYDEETKKVRFNDKFKVKNKKPKMQKPVDLMSKWSSDNVLSYEKMWNAHIDKFGTTNQSEYEVTESKSSLSSEDL
jgi:hypothetical protein